MDMFVFKLPYISYNIETSLLIITFNNIAAPITFCFNFDALLSS